ALSRCAFVYRILVMRKISPRFRPHPQIAKQQNWGRDALAKVNTTPHNENEADQQTGRPALYDNAIPTDYNHNLGVQKGWIGT
ncbi:hypothetical protein QP933_09080, partial [Corynebacterium pseudodiphtheriticum]|nr:hypothetical protein [Corynebacterium pseudodiphtheriticum]MDK8584585.1 hypothetical protein [Corynebacterium pseudodiphtheriticum]MDK8840336.1 hypothetical protein [Corynebacterium pseudodiphtheriticum]